MSFSIWYGVFKQKEERVETLNPGFLTDCQYTIPIGGSVYVIERSFASPTSSVLVSDDYPLFGFALETDGLASVTVEIGVFSALANFWFFDTWPLMPTLGVPGTFVNTLSGVRLPTAIFRVKLSNDDAAPVTISGNIGQRGF